MTRGSDPFDDQRPRFAPDPGLLDANPSPDTGAGTPLTAEQAIDDAMRVAAILRSSDATASLANRLDIDLRAIRSRPATDPAGLDALAVLDEVIRILTKYEHSVMVDSTELRPSFAARLSVADGPGPEERPDLEAAAREFAAAYDALMEPSTDSIGPRTMQYDRAVRALRAALPADD